MNRDGATTRMILVHPSTIVAVFSLFIFFYFPLLFLFLDNSPSPSKSLLQHPRGAAIYEAHWPLPAPLAASASPVPGPGSKHATWPSGRVDCPDREGQLQGLFVVGRLVVGNWRPDDVRERRPRERKDSCGREREGKGRASPHRLPGFTHKKNSQTTDKNTLAKRKRVNHWLNHTG